MTRPHVCSTDDVMYSPNKICWPGCDMPPALRALPPALRLCQRQQGALRPLRRPRQVGLAVQPWVRQRPTREAHRPGRVQTKCCCCCQLPSECSQLLIGLLRQHTLQTSTDC